MKAIVKSSLVEPWYQYYIEPAFTMLIWISFVTLSFRLQLPIWSLFLGSGLILGVAYFLGWISLIVLMGLNSLLLVLTLPRLEIKKGK